MGVRRLDPEEALLRRRARSAAWKEKNQDKVKQYRKDRYRENSEADKQKAAAWYQANQMKALSASAERQLQRYGLTLAEYKQLLDAQQGICAICKKEPVEGDRRLAVDHDHITSEVRGLLCLRCNVGIGQFNDDPDLLIKAAAYLENSRRKT